jgi:hypothetical protein
MAHDKYPKEQNRIAKNTILRLSSKDTKRRARFVKGLLEELVEVCASAMPLVDVETWRKTLKGMSWNQMFSLKFMADETAGVNRGDLPEMLGMTQDRIKYWEEADTVFRYVREVLTTGYKLKRLKPLVIAVVTEGLERRETVTDKDGTVRDVGRKFDTVTGVLVGRALEILGNEQTVNVKLPKTDQEDTEEKAKKDRLLATFLKEHKELAGVLASKVSDVRKELTPAHQVEMDGAVTVDADGNLKAGGDAQEA